jgi:hypothetical protein
MTANSLHPPSSSRQIIFHELLVAARKTWLIDALRDGLKAINQNELKRQLMQYVPEDVQKILATSGVRDELVFPTPILLEAKPSLVGYYRLLLGAPQKWFHASGTGLGRFKGMELRGVVSPSQKAGLPGFCEAMSKELAHLVRRASSPLGERDITELPLLTIGSQFQGSNNTKIGKQAVASAFVAVTGIVKHHILSQSERELVIRNSAGRRVRIQLGSDPDIGIEEEFGTTWRKKVAIEIKGGTDRSNAHNRVGEAEKSHQKARASHFRDFWTIISKRGLDMRKITEESPTTTSWYDAIQVLGQSGEDWDDFRSRFCEVVGIPIETELSSP